NIVWFYIPGVMQEDRCPNYDVSINKESVASCNVPTLPLRLNVSLIYNKTFDLVPILQSSRDSRLPKLSVRYVKFSLDISSNSRKDKYATDLVVYIFRCYVENL